VRRKRITYKIAVPNRNGYTAEGLQRAISAFYQAHHTLPASIVVSPSAVGVVLDLLDALDLPAMPVAGNGGVLVGEIWMEVAKS